MSITSCVFVWRSFSRLSAALFLITYVLTCLSVCSNPYDNKQQAKMKLQSHVLNYNRQKYKTIEIFTFNTLPVIRDYLEVITSSPPKKASFSHFDPYYVLKLLRLERDPNSRKLFTWLIKLIKRTSWYSYVFQSEIVLDLILQRFA